MIRDRRGAAGADVMLVLSALALLVALAYPPLKGAAARDRAEAAAFAANVVVDAARRFRAERGAWPSGAGLGAIPEGMAPYLPGGFSFEGQGFSLRWDRWERIVAVHTEAAPFVVEPPPLTGDAPPPLAAADSSAAVGDVTESVVVTVGAVTVRSGDPGVLGALLERFGPSTSWVRDDTWTLVIPADPGGP